MTRRSASTADTSSRRSARRVGQDLLDAMTIVLGVVAVAVATIAGVRIGDWSALPLAVVLAGAGTVAVITTRRRR